MRKMLGWLKDDQRGVLAQFCLGVSVPIVFVCIIAAARSMFETQLIWVSVAAGAMIIFYSIANHFANRAAGPLPDGYLGFITRLCPFLLGAVPGALLFLPLLRVGK